MIFLEKKRKKRKESTHCVTDRRLLLCMLISVNCRGLSNGRVLVYSSESSSGKTGPGFLTLLSLFSLVVVAGALGKSRSTRRIKRSRGDRYRAPLERLTLFIEIFVARERVTMHQPGKCKSAPYLRCVSRRCPAPKNFAIAQKRYYISY